MVKLRKASESVGWLNSEGPLSMPPFNNAWPKDGPRRAFVAEAVKLINGIQFYSDKIGPPVPDCMPITAAPTLPASKGLTLGHLRALADAYDDTLILMQRQRAAIRCVVTREHCSELTPGQREDCGCEGCAAFGA